jgi:hypothetical protein
MRRAPNQPETISVSIYAGIYYKLYRVPDANTVLPQHAHEFGHLTALLQGAVMVWCDDELLGHFRAPATIRIAPHVKHRFLTLEPETTLACIHNADHLEADEPAVAAEHHLSFEED